MSTSNAGGASRPQRHRARWIGLGLVGALVVGVGVSEALGWPYLAGPMQSTLTRLLDRPVRFDNLADTGAQAPGPAASAPEGTERADGVRIRLLGRIEVSAQRIEVAAPDWSEGPPLIVGDNASVVLRYSDLWRAWRGAPITVRRLAADRLAVALVRKSDGRASWQFGEPKPDQEPGQLPKIELLQVRDGHLQLDDEQLDSKLEARYTLTDRSPGSAASAPAGPASQSASDPADAPPDGLRLTATGRYRGLPLKLEASSPGVLALASEAAGGPEFPFKIDGSVGYARFDFDGTVRDVRELSALKGRYSLAGRSLAAVGDVIGVTLPTTPAFSVRGTLVKDGESWSTQVDEAKIGQSVLNAELRYDRAAGKKPLLAGRVGGARLLLADLGPAVGTKPAVDVSEPEPARKRVTKASGRVLPAREFDLPSLRAMNADVRLAFDKLDLGTPRLEPLTPLRAHLVLQDGVLKINDIDARTASGSVSGKVSLDGRESLALWQADIGWKGIRLEQWLNLKRSGSQPPYLSGSLEGRARLQGRGRSTAQILAAMDGDFTTRVHNGSVSHLIVEGAGIDLAQAVGVWFKGDEPLRMSCALVDLKIKDGIARPQAMVIDTVDSVIWVDGSISLADESLSLKAVTSPKDFSPLSLRTPVLVGGTLGSPAISLAPEPLAGKAIAAGLLSLLNPLAALLPLMDLGTGDDRTQGCHALASRAAERKGRS